MGTNSLENEHDQPRKELYSLDNTLGELLDHEIAKDMFEQFAQGATNDPCGEEIYKKTIAEILTKDPSAKPMYEAMIAALNAQERVK